MRQHEKCVKRNVRQHASFSIGRLGRRATASAEAIFTKISTEKKRLLKAKIPALRRLRDPKVYEDVDFQWYTNGRHDVEITGFDGVKYGLKGDEDGVTTEIFKYTDTADDSNRLLKKTHSDARLQTVAESFVKMLNRKGNLIKRLEVNGNEDVLAYFHPLKAQVDYLTCTPNFEYTSRSLLNFKNLQSLVLVLQVIPKIMMEDILSLDIPAIHLLAYEFPDNSHLELKSAVLELQEFQNTFEFFVQFVKKLCSGAHAESSEYKLNYFEEGDLTKEEFYEKFATYFPSARPTTNDEEWHYPMIFSQSSSTLQISDELELSVRPSGYVTTARVQRRGTAKPAINDS